MNKLHLRFLIAILKLLMQIRVAQTGRVSSLARESDLLQDAYKELKKLEG